MFYYIIYIYIYNMHASMKWRGKLSVQRARARPSMTRQAPGFFWNRPNCSSTYIYIYINRQGDAAPPPALLSPIRVTGRPTDRSPGGDWAP